MCIPMFHIHICSYTQTHTHSDKPRELEDHFRIRFNASGLADENAPIQIKKPLLPALVESPVAFKEMQAAGLDTSVCLHFFLENVYFMYNAGAEK